MVTINIGRKELIVFCAFVLVFSVGGFVVATWNPTKAMFHEANDVKVTISGTNYSLQEAIDGGLISGNRVWSSEWIAVEKKKVYLNGGTDAKGTQINLNHNLGTQNVITQILYAPDTGNFPSSPNTDLTSAIVGHSDSNVDYRGVHSGVLLQEIRANSIGKLITGHESVGIWDNGDSNWDDFRKDKGWIKIIVSN